MFVDDQGSEGVVSQDAHRDDGENQKFDDTNEKTHVVVFARIDKIHVSWSVNDSSSSPLPADPKIAALRWFRLSVINAILICENTTCDT